MSNDNAFYVLLGVKGDFRANKVLAILEVYFTLPKKKKRIAKTKWKKKNTSV